MIRREDRNDKSSKKKEMERRRGDEGREEVGEEG